MIPLNESISTPSLLQLKEMMHEDTILQTSDVILEEECKGQGASDRLSIEDSQESSFSNSQEGSFAEKIEVILSQDNLDSQPEVAEEKMQKKGKVDKLKGGPEQQRRSDRLVRYEDQRLEDLATDKVEAKDAFLSEKEPRRMVEAGSMLLRKVASEAFSRTQGWGPITRRIMF